MSAAPASRRAKSPQPARHTLAAWGNWHTQMAHPTPVSRRGPKRLQIYGVPGVRNVTIVWGRS